jgi:hypothetical protein
LHYVSCRIRLQQEWVTIDQLKYDIIELSNKNKELEIFYKEVSKYSLDKIICLDETSIQPLMMINYSRCTLGQRCILETSDNYVFRKFSLLVSINNSKCIGHKLYENGVMTKERFVEFLEKFVFNKYKKHLIILDNAGSHNNEYVKNAIIESGNKYSNFKKSLHAKAECCRLPFAPDFCAYNGPKNYNDTPVLNSESVKYKTIKNYLSQPCFAKPKSKAS